MTDILLSQKTGKGTLTDTGAYCSVKTRASREYMYLPDNLADFFLAFANLYVLSLIVTVGLLWINRALFFQAVCVSAFNIIVNVALKGTFKVPLSAGLGKIGYAFPSGHMELATVFYVWLGVSIVSIAFRGGVALLLAGIAVSLIHYGYHNPQDVLAGFICGLLIVACCRYLMIYYTKLLGWVLLSVASCLMFYNSIVYITIPVHAWAAYFILLLGLFLGLKKCYLFQAKSF